MTDKNQSEWHLSKSVPITLIVAIILQTISLVGFVYTLRNDVSNNSKELARITVTHETRIDTLEKIVQNQAIMLARIDENLKAIRTAVERNERNR